MIHKKFFNIITTLIILVAFVGGVIFGYKKSGFDNLSLNQFIGNEYGNPFISQEK